VPKVERRWVGDAVPPAPAPSTEPEYEPNRSWDKLLILVGAVVVVIALLVVPGLLNRGGQNPVAAAAEATSNSAGVRMNFSGRFQGQTPMTMSGRADLDGETDQASIQMSMTGSSLSGTEGVTFDEIIDGGDLYLHSPQLGSLFGDPGRWLLMRSEIFGDLLQGDASGAGMSGSPTQQLDALKDASYQVDEVGSEQVNGMATTHYRALLDLDKVADQMKSKVSGEFSDAIERSMQQIESSVVDVWISDDGLLRRETTSTSMGPQGMFTMTMDFSRYGVRPQIQVPPQSQVSDVTSLMQQALDQAGAG
jgi:hypothetical protein